MTPKSAEEILREAKEVVANNYGFNNWRVMEESLFASCMFADISDRRKEATAIAMQTYAQQEAVEFGEWILLSGYHRCNTEKFWVNPYRQNVNDIYASTEQLYSLFKNRKK